MRLAKYVIWAVVIFFGIFVELASGYFVLSLDVKRNLDSAAIVCKVKVGAVVQTKVGSSMVRIDSDRDGSEYEADCQVISAIKGDAGKQIKVQFFGKVFVKTLPLEVGKAYIVFLHEGEEHELMGAVEGKEEGVEAVYGKEPVDLLLAELAAAAGGKDVRMRVAAIEQLGKLRDARVGKVVAAAALDKDPLVVREAVIAEYLMRIAPDAKTVMGVFNERVMNVWYEESGVPRKNADGSAIWRREDGHPFLERGLVDFDYATYVREGIKLDWVRKDDDTLYRFFGVPWKVQRKACVPELMKLLDDGDERVRWWAVECLTHTVEDKDEPKWEEYKGNEGKFLDKWRGWWKESGDGYMARKADKE